MLIKTALLFVIIGITCAAPLLDESQAKTVGTDSGRDEAGNYNFWFETSNGINRHEKGTAQNVGQQDQYIVVRGEYSYTDPEGNLVTVRYRADENGFHILAPGEDVIPPAIGGAPPAVVASLLG